MFDKMWDSFINWFVSKCDIIILNIDKYSFEVFMIVGLVALILSVFGYKKGKNIALISPAAYVILQIFLSVWFGI